MASAAWLEEVKRVLAHVAASDATEVEFARQGLRVRIKRRPGARTIRVSPDGAAALAAEGAAVVAPLTGVFYRSNSPTTPPYVSEGDLVRPETVVGLIETMKIFNEVAAERRGRIVKVLVESGQLVHAGDGLMVIDESAEQPSEQVEM